MTQSNNLQRIYQDLRRRGVGEFGEHCGVELESYLRTAAQQISDVDNAEVHPNLEPLNQEQPGRYSSVAAANREPIAALAPPPMRLKHA